MENSVESSACDDMLLFPCDDIVSTSLENKSVIFADIENQLETDHSNMLEELQTKFGYNKVLREIMIYSLHKKYINRIYQSVLYQLIRERRMREYSKFYYSLIS
jgi:hypothetical protein